MTPCICDPARQAAEQGRGMGHLRLQCLTCEEEGVVTIRAVTPGMDSGGDAGGWRHSRARRYRPSSSANNGS